MLPNAMQCNAPYCGKCKKIFPSKNDSDYHNTTVPIVLRTNHHFVVATIVFLQIVKFIKFYKTMWNLKLTMNKLILLKKPGLIICMTTCEDRRFQ
jgi:hypothetical protein